MLQRSRNGVSIKSRQCGNGALVTIQDYTSARVAGFSTCRRSSQDFTLEVTRSKMRGCRLLLLVCLTLVADGSRKSIEGSAQVTPYQENTISLPPPVHYLSENDSLNMVIDERRASYPHTLMDEDLLRKDDERLTSLLITIIKAEMSQCALGIVWDSGSATSTTIDSLLLLPNAKQVVGDGEVEKLLWRAKQCRGYIFLLTNPSSLIHVAEYPPSNAWDYSGRMVIAGLSEPQIDTFIRTEKGRKTEHILGIVKDTYGNFVVLTNQLFKKNRLARMFTWRTPISTIPSFSSEQSSKSKLYPMNRNLIMKHSMPTPNITQNFFRDKTENLQGSILNVITFAFPPAIMYRHNIKNDVVPWYGDNVRLVETVSKIMNFTIRFTEPPPGELWGHQLPNGTWNGMVGLFARGEGDIGIANLFITAMGGRNEHQEFTSPYGQESTCILVKKGRRMPRWQAIALPFQKDTWFAVLGVAVFVGPLLFALACSLVTSDDKLSGQSLAYICLYTFGVHLKNSRPQLPVRVSLQIFVLFLWVYVMIVMEAYSAKLMSFLTVERIPEGINTFEELYHSSLPIYGQSHFWAQSLSAAKNVHARKLSAHYTTLTDYDSIYKHLLSGQGAYIASTNNLIYTISIFSQNGKPTLRLMKECFQPFNTAMGLQSHSPLKRSVDRAVSWVVEAGLFHHWLRETLMIAREDSRNASKHFADSPVSESNSGVPFSLEHLQGVFIVFGIGCGLSFLVFAAELLNRGHRSC